MKGPIRVLELRSVRGTGGGPEKTILLGAALADPARFVITVCYIRDRRDDVFAIDRRARQSAVDYIEILERHSFDPSSWSELQSVIRGRRIDIVHAHDYKTDALARLLQSRTGTIALATAHGWTGHSWRERLLYYPMDKRLLTRFRRVVAVSGEIRDTLLACGADPARVSVILNGIDPQQFRRDHSRRGAARVQYGIEPGEFAVGSVGRLEPQKRFDLLIDAFKSLFDRDPKLRLLIAGDGSLRSALSRQIERLGLSSVCRLVGQADVITFHHALDIFVQSSDYEGTPNVVLEAMALETPIVATDVGGTAELVTHGVHGLVIPPSNITALISAICELIDDPVSTMKRVQAARIRTETDLSFENRMHALERIYETLMSEKLALAAGNRCLSSRDRK